MTKTVKTVVLVGVGAVALYTAYRWLAATAPLTNSSTLQTWWTNIPF